MNILSMNISDLGGLSYNLCHAINKLTPHHALNCVEIRPFTQKPVMLDVTVKRQKMGRHAFHRHMAKLVKNADVLHFNEKWSLVGHYGIIPEACKDKKVIFHAHGGIFRRSSASIMRCYRRAFPQMKVITSTADLVAYHPKSTWFPSIIPIRQLRRKFKMRRNARPTVYYSPSGSSTKAMKQVIHEVCRQLRNQGSKFRLKVTTKTVHSLNMRWKSKADIYYDEIAPSPFYGVNAIEAGAFELAVICNMTEFAKNYLRAHEVDCPFLVVAKQNPLKRVLRKLIFDRSYREKLGRKGYRYVKDMHSPKVCVKRFLQLLEE